MYPKHVGMQISCSHKTQGAFLGTIWGDTCINLIGLNLNSIFRPIYHHIWIFSFWGNPFDLKLLLRGVARAISKVHWGQLNASDGSFSKG
jgi:hypothetical protein